MLFSSILLTRVLELRKKTEYLETRIKVLNDKFNTFNIYQIEYW